jgi:CRP-like cAMP-binding protein
VPWINGSQEVLEVMKLLFEERQHETASQFLTADNEPDGIYLLVSGVVSLTYHRRYLDNPDLGQIYNCDNLRATVEEGSAEDESPRLDYILPGGLINEQSLALGFPRRSDATSDTAISVSFPPN